MNEFITPHPGHTKKGQIYSTVSLDGQTQMAIDLFLLEKSITQNDLELLIRFYTWEGIWLSIGYNQKEIPLRWKDLAKKEILKIVRRPSGGSAVLHAGGLTYSLIWKSPPRKKRASYKQASEWLLKSYSTMGLPLKFGNQTSNALSKHCFATSSSADLIDGNGVKRIGSAQLWRKNHLLQHGEILLDPPKEVWEEVFQVPSPPPTSKRIPRTGLDKVLTKTFKECWQNINWEQKSFTDKELLDLKQSYSQDLYST